MKRFNVFENKDIYKTIANWKVGKYWISKENGIWVPDYFMERPHDYLDTQEDIVEHIFGKDAVEKADEYDFNDMLDEALDSFEEVDVPPLTVVIYLNRIEEKSEYVFVRITDVWEAEYEFYGGSGVLEYATFSGEGKYDSALSWARGKGLDHAREIASKRNDVMLDGIIVEYIILLDALLITGRYEDDYEANVVMVERA